MGLDLYLITDNYYEELSNEFADGKYDLSREFCYFFFRKEEIEYAELDQIAEITGVDVNPIYEMNNYPDEEYTDYRLECEARNQQERQKILDEVEAEKKKLEGNIDKVLQTVSSLIAKLNTINNLYGKLNKTEPSNWDIEHYLSDFNTDKSKDSFIGNFGQDLRNFKDFLEYAKSKETKTVWFLFM